MCCRWSTGRPILRLPFGSAAHSSWSNGVQPGSSGAQSAQEADIAAISKALEWCGFAGNRGSTLKSAQDTSPEALPSSELAALYRKRRGDRFVHQVTFQAAPMSPPLTNRSEPV